MACHANNTLVEHCKFGTGHGASIGSLDGGWYKNITFRDIEFDGTTQGARIKSRPGASMGKVWDITYENLSMKNVKTALEITQFYGSDKTEQSYLYIDGVTFKNITSEDTGRSAIFDCSSRARTRPVIGRVPPTASITTPQASS